MKLRLEELREKRGLTRRDVYEATGISMNTLLLYAKGGTPSIKHIEKIAETYHVNPAWLLGWIEHERGQEPVEKVVYVDRYVGRIPRYWNNDCDGKLIRWKESRKR